MQQQPVMCVTQKRLVCNQVFLFCITYTCLSMESKLNYWEWNMYLVLFQWYKVDIFSDKKWTQTTDCEKNPLRWYDCCKNALSWDYSKYYAQYCMYYCCIVTWNPSENREKTRRWCSTWCRWSVIKEVNYQDSKR